ncbi:MAG: flagellar hook-associated protein FlgL [Ignavibacteria bacterium]|nr:flagellar hook-associated protein FlgL [Ignavibacteria bacterium]
MRVTEGTIASNFLFNVNKSRERIVQLQSQLATGRRVLRPSDDPQAADTILRLNGSILRNEQFEKNATNGIALVETTESALDNFSNHLLEIKEMLVRMKGTAEPDSLKAFAEQLDLILSDLVDIANTKFDGKYIFGGTRTLTQPYTLASDRSAVTENPNGVTGSIEFQVGEGIRQVVNIDGLEAFGGTQIFDAVIAMRDVLRAGTLPTAAQADQIDTFLGSMNNTGAKAGQARLFDQRVELMGLLSIHQDTDIAESTLRLKHEEIMLDAALNTGARIIPKSLMDFLR